MEFDCYQPYFFDALDMEEDFYKSTAPSEDIWKKFELLPTPPMSPHRTLHLSPGDKLSWLSMVLGQDEDWGAQFLSGAEDHRDHIIQDCMWSSGPACKEMVAGRVPAVAQTGALPTATARPSKAQCASPGSFLSTATDCVDPAAVLTIPASSCRKPASSGSESRSDSSDDEEEIDVVTVESKQNRMRLVRKPVTLTVRADPCPKRFHVSVHKQQHNYAARSPDSDPEPDEEDDDDEEEEQQEVDTLRPSDSACLSKEAEAMVQEDEEEDKGLSEESSSAAAPEEQEPTSSTQAEMCTGSDPEEEEDEEEEEEEPPVEKEVPCGSEEEGSDMDQQEASEGVQERSETSRDSEESSSDPVSSSSSSSNSNSSCSIEEGADGTPAPSSSTTQPPTEGAVGSATSHTGTTEEPMEQD
uniref:V-myc myelocytomatosis viral oncogene homolog 1, lung carcinoma derived (Avian) a n=2 Tax=Nothobranchius pienaari TaxID=704102 RepID=A0A1A8MAY5_9TELE